MSVLIKDMEMPTSCTMCWLNTFCGVWNTEPVKHKGFNERLEDCPLTELIQCEDCIHNVANRKTDPMDITDYSGQDIVCDYFMTDGQEPDDYCSKARTKETEKCC